MAAQEQAAESLFAGFAPVSAVRDLAVFELAAFSLKSVTD